MLDWKPGRFRCRQYAGVAVFLVFNSDFQISSCSADVKIIADLFVLLERTSTK